MSDLKFDIPGEPVTQGSVKPGFRKDGSLFTRHDNGYAIKNWREVALLIIRPHARRHKFRKGTPVAVVATFVCKRPKKPSYFYPVKDLDKYQRALGDVLTLSGLIEDDSQIIEWRVFKLYGEPRTIVEVTAFEVRAEESA